MRVLVSVVVCALIAGCQTVKHAPISEAASAQMQGKTFAVVRYPYSDFYAFTAGKAAFSLIGAGAMVAEGNKLVQTHNIQDPAAQIADSLALQLAEKRGLQKIDVQGAAKSDKPVDLVAAYPGAHYLLDVKTGDWLFAYYPSNWSHYRVIYRARFRLIDTATKKSVAETACSTVQGDDKNPPSKDQLLANDAALLKSYLQKAAVTCTDLLSRELLKLGPAAGPPMAAVQTPPPTQ